MTHELLSPAPEMNTRLVKYGCSCGTWHRVYHDTLLPRGEEIESDHEDHRQRAGAEELRAGALRPLEAGLEGLLRMMAKVVAESAKAAEAMGEFLSAHEQAKGQGVGVVVVRKADGSITSTPNVFVQAGTAIFVDDPSMTPPLPGFMPPVPVIPCIPEDEAA